MAKKGAKEVITTPTTPEKATRAGRPVRLDLPEVDHDRLERLARERGLTKASYARQALMERMKVDEAKD